MNKFGAVFALLLLSKAFAYNYLSTEKVPVKIRIETPILSQKDVYEGQKVNFKAVESVCYKNHIIVRKNDNIEARIQLLITSGMNGIPASIVFNNFKIDGVSDNQLTQSLEVFGQDRSLWVFPLKWALTPLPPTGSLTNFIKGGNVKVKANKEFTIYYHPYWE